MELDHNNEIISTRVGGFGGSDAKLFYKIGKSGLSSLNNTEVGRIMIAKGMQEYHSKTTPAMEKGHKFEDWFASGASGYDREVFLKQPLAAHFFTFCHADFVDTPNMAVYELKCTKYPEKALQTYYPQLQWYYIMGAKSVNFVVCDASKDNFLMGLQTTQPIERDEETINTILKGVKVLDAQWATFGDVIGQREVNDDKGEELLIALDNARDAYNKAQAAYDLAQLNVKEYLEEKGLDNMHNGTIFVSMISGNTRKTLDLKRLQEENPSINLDSYYKVSDVKPSLRIKRK